MNGYLLAAAAGSMATLTGLFMLVAALMGISAPPRPRRPGRPGRARAVTGRVGTARSWALAGTAAVAALLVTGWVPVAAGAGGVAVLLPRMARSRRAARTHIERLEALAGWTRRVADLLASGVASSLQDALYRSAATGPGPIKAELDALAARLHPQGLERALRAFAHELADPVADQVVMALVVRARHGGAGLAKVLTALAADVEDQVRMARTISTERDKTLASSRAVVALTLSVWVGTLVFARDYLTPYATPAGQVVLALIVAVFAAALVWLARLCAPIVGPRLLSTPAPGRGWSR